MIHFDVDVSEIGKLRRADVSIVGTLKRSLRHVRAKPQIAEWLRRCAALKQEFAWDYDAPTDGVYAPRMLRDLSDAAGENTYICCDVGQHQMWVAQHYQFKHRAST